MNLCPVASSYYIATIFHNIVIQNITKSYLKISNFFLNCLMFAIKEPLTKLIKAGG